MATSVNFAIPIFIAISFLSRSVDGGVGSILVKPLNFTKPTAAEFTNTTEVALKIKFIAQKEIEWNHAFTSDGKAHMTFTDADQKTLEIFTENIQNEIEGSCSVTAVGAPENSSQVTRTWTKKNEDIMFSFPDGCKFSVSLSTSCEDASYYGKNCEIQCVRDVPAVEDCSPSGEKICGVGYTGPSCILTDRCLARKPCKNGGTCSNIRHGYSCSCTTGYEGDNCETIYRYCAHNRPCSHGGTCVDNEGGRFSCLCPPHIEGERCERSVHECTWKTPCKNGATCLKVGATFTCSCRSGFEGKTCEDDIDECEKFKEALPCKNDGKCINTLGSFSCNCSSGFTGEKCDIIKARGRTKKIPLTGMVVFIFASSLLSGSLLCLTFVAIKSARNKARERSSRS